MLQRLPTAVVEQCEPPALLVDDEAVGASMHDSADLEPTQHTVGCGRRRCEVQSALAHDVVQHHVRAQQVHPPGGAEQLAGLDRALRRGRAALVRIAGRVDPDVGARGVDVEQRPQPSR